MQRVIVLGASGFFGRAAMEQLRLLGISATPASRSGTNGVAVDANDYASIRRAISNGDLVLDAAGPFKGRSMALVDAAIEVGFDLIDINEDLEYAEQVLNRRNRIGGAGIHVLSSASSVSAVAAAMVQYAGVLEPVRITSFLAPALRHTAHRGVALSMIRSLGQSIRVWRNGTLQLVDGHAKRQFEMPRPIGKIRGRLFESADSLYLPHIWPSLKNVEMYVAARTPAMNVFLNLASRSPNLRKKSERFVGLGAWFARKIGPFTGGIGYEIETSDSRIHRIAVIGAGNSFITAVAPAVLATKAIIEGRLETSGLILPDQQIDPMELVKYLKAAEIEVRNMQ